MEQAAVIAIDAPCLWSAERLSRLAERDLKINGKILQCFRTPTKAHAGDRDFYGWVRNGQLLYASLQSNGYDLYDGERRSGKLVLETFPHAVVCALRGQIVPARRKASTRRDVLNMQKIIGHFPNIDFVDAALCALTAQRFLHGQTQQFGDTKEGFIVVPTTSTGT